MSRKSPAVVVARTGLVAQRNAALAKMSKSLLAVFSRVEAADGQIAAAAMEYYYDVGVELNRVAEKPNDYLTPEQIAKGVDAMALLMQAFGASKDSKTRAMTFARLYDRRDMARLLDTKSKNFPDFKFQWAHVRHLISVDPKHENSQLRLDFENKTRENVWTPNDLADAIIQHYGGKRRNGGRPLTAPKTLTGQLAQVIEMSDLFVRRHKEVWNGEKHSIFVNIMNQPKTSLGEDTALRVTTIRNRMQEVRKAADEQLAMCERTLQYLEGAEEAPAGASATNRAATAVARAKSRIT